MRVLEEKIGVLRVALEECNIDPAVCSLIPKNLPEGMN